MKTTNHKLKKFRHNKKRNTAFLYEVLCNELTKTIVAKNTPRQALIMRVIQEHFHKGYVHKGYVPPRASSLDKLGP